MFCSLHHTVYMYGSNHWHERDSKRFVSDGFSSVIAPDRHSAAAKRADSSSVLGSPTLSQRNNFKLSNSPCPLGRSPGRGRYNLLARAINNKPQCSNVRSSPQWRRSAARVELTRDIMIRTTTRTYQFHTDTSPVAVNTSSLGDSDNFGGLN